AAGRNGVVKTWAQPSGAPGRVLSGHTGSVFAVAALPGSGRVASAGADGTVRVWDAGAGTSDVLTGHEGPVRAMATTADGRLITGGDDDTLRVWEPARQKTPVATWRGNDRDVLAVAAHPSGALVASGAAGGSVRIWDAGGEGRVIDTFDSEVRALAWSPDGETLAAAGADGRIRRYAGPDWEAAGDAGDHGAEIRDLAWSGDGSVLASAGRDLVIRLWAGDSQLAALSPHASDVRAVAFVAGDRSVVSASNDGLVRVWPAPAAWAEVACALAGRDLTPEEWDRFAAGVGGPRPALC
ncbi:MAG: WD40 repeat domain-containing protein, partial [Acidimicrobiales bacterium]|nr:WD40 repeat domain-containing protein [Acidimicrobiales bacterium]